MMIRMRTMLLFLLCMIVAFPTIGAFAEAGGGPASDAQKGTITGRVVIKGIGPMAGGFVMIYDAQTGPPPMPEKYNRIPEISRELDIEGKFRVDLPPGKYYLGAVRRLSGERIGALQPGDYVFRSVDAQGKPKEYVVKSGEVLDAGNELEAIALPPQKETAQKTVGTSIEGIIIDMEGKPVADAVVTAFTSPTLRGKPLFASEKSDAQGKYTLVLTPGTYYLRVRNSFAAGPPEPGQIVGYFGETSPAPVSVKEGEIRQGINFRVILFPGRGPFSTTVPGEPPAR